MQPLRALFLSLIAVAMIATGIGVGMARGAMAADGQLCSVTGPSPVVLAHDGLPLFDGDGAPVTLDWSQCLDCLMTVVDLPQRTVTAPAPATLALAILLPPSSHWIPARAQPGGLARAPPRAA